MRIRTYIYLFCLAISVGSFSPVMGQYNAYKNTQVFIILENIHGSIQWQQSPDNISWKNIQDADNDTLQMLADTSGLFRAVITDGTCNPFYTDSIPLSILTFTCGDSLVDYRDGRKYATVLIGTQCWMAENLNTGTMITGIANASNNSIIEKYCYNNDVNYCITYGALYQWNEAMNYSTVPGSQGICPEGWHIPDDEEWKVLEQYLGMSKSEADLGNDWRGTDEGIKMKQSGSSGYDAMLSGGRFSDGSFNYLGVMEYVWTSTESGSYAWRRCLSNAAADVGRWNTFPKNYGFSVRCIKD